VYDPHFNALEDADAVRALVAATGSAELVTVGADGYPLVTLLPVVWEPEDDGPGRLLMHAARANPHWRSIPDDPAGTPALAVVTGPQAYVSPAWYATKEENPRVVPTWNYSAVHFTGRARRHEGPAWLLDMVTRLTEQHESGRPVPWSVDDAPATYVEKQLRAIVGIELTLERVEAKAKLSQNKGRADIDGVVAGLRAEGGSREREVADQMDALER
jgi:transcriptional regulator